MSPAAVAAGLLAGCAALLWPALPASAHAALVHTDPGAGAVLAAAPAEVRLRFTEAVSPVAAQTAVLTPTGGRADVAPPVSAGQSVVLRLDTGLTDGTYRVTYRVVSDDGHPVAGGFSFSVGAPSAVGGGYSTPGRQAVDPAVAVALPVVRYLGLVGLVLLAGPAVFLAALWPRRLSSRAPVRLALVGAGVLAVDTLVELYLQAPYRTGGSAFSASAGELAEVLSGRVGLALAARVCLVLVAVLVALPALNRLGRPDAGPGPRWALAVLGGLAVLTWPLSGHAGSSRVPQLTVLTDAVHVAAMATWLGGLVVLVALVLRRADHDELTSLLPLWSRWATGAVVALGVAGLTQAVVLVGSWNALLHTRYGALLLAKAALFGVILLAAAGARRAARGPDPGAVRTRLRRVVGVELAGAAVVLGLTAALVQTVPARAAQQEVGPGFEVTVGTAVASIRLQVAPARVGRNTVQVTALRPDGGAIAVQTWFASASLTNRALAPVTVSLRAVSGDQAAGSVDLPLAGSWRFRMALRVVDPDGGEADSTSVTAVVRVR